MAGRCFLPRPHASPVKNIEVFSRKRSMILQRKVYRSRLNEVKGRRRRGRSRDVLFN